MEVREIANLQSLTRTQELCNRKSGEFVSLSMYGEQVTILGGYISNINDENKKLQASSHGFTEAKNATKAILMKQLMLVITRLQAYANFSNDTVIKNEVKVTNTSIAQMHESLLGTFCRRLLDICRDKMSVLESFSLTAEMLDPFENAIRDFELKLNGTPQYRGEQKAARQNIELWLGQAMELVKTKLDPLFEIIRYTNPETYVEYKNARKIEITSRRTLSLKGKVLCGTDSQPVQKAMVTISKMENGDQHAGSGTELSKVVKYSAAKGGFDVASLPAGHYSLTAEKEGYTCKPVNVYINDNEMSYAELIMEKL